MKSNFQFLRKAENEEKMGPNFKLWGDKMNRQSNRNIPHQEFFGKETFPVAERVSRGPKYAD